MLLYLYYLQIRVLGMDLEKGVLDVTMDTELVKVSHPYSWADLPLPPSFPAVPFQQYFMVARRIEHHFRT